MSKKRFYNYLNISLAVLVGLFVALTGFATDYSSSSFKVKDPVITEGLDKSTSINFGLGQSLWQTAIGKSTSTSFQLWGGFQYFFKANSNTLTATAGDGQVSLSWSVPQTFLGVSAGGYELGTGTVSGSYTYEDVGNVTSFVKSGLNNGTVYFFKVKAKTTGGTFLTFSNEATATPTGQVQQGGGGGSAIALATFSGQAYPNSQVFLLKDGILASVATTDPSGQFYISLSNLLSGSYKFLLYAKDKDGRRSSLFSVPINIAIGQTVHSTNIFIAPTISVDNSEIKQGSNLKIFGYSAPSSAVVISISPSFGNLIKTTSDERGFYSYSLDTSSLAFGSYVAKSKALLKNLESAFNDGINFIVGTKTIPIPPFRPCPLKYDLNNDCKVNLIDFSILAYWYEKPQFPSEMDFNNDHIVDLVDFSILVYYWQE